MRACFVAYLRLLEPVGFTTFTERGGFRSRWEVEGVPFHATLVRDAASRSVYLVPSPGCAGSPIFVEGIGQSWMFWGFRLLCFAYIGLWNWRGGEVRCRAGCGPWMDEAGWRMV